jgi:hypothetical protein
MRRSTWFLVITLIATAGHAASIDMKDPRRAVGAEDDVRVDAQLTTEVVSAHSPIGVKYQIHNLSSRTIAVADRLCEASYDSDSATIMLSVGSEVPSGGEMPRLVIIPSGETRTLTAGAMVKSSPTAQRLKTPAFVQIRVNVLRDAGPFMALMERQKRASAGIALSDEEFDQWLKLNESIVLNTIPVRYRAAEETRTDASQR